MAHFIFWYGFPRIFVGYFRVYPVTLFGLPPGQEFNIFMSLAGGRKPGDRPKDLIVFRRDVCDKAQKCPPTI